MKITFHGAAGEVTGSCALLESRDARILVDFGLHQGGEDDSARNRRLPPVKPASLDAVVLTHAHLDHSGRLPLLPPAGLEAPIHATPATIDLCGILLKDAAKLQEMDAESRSRRRERKGRPDVAPLYTGAEVEVVLDRLQSLGYDQPREIARRVTLQFADAGHILGSASAMLTVQEGDQTRRILFSGDIGPTGAPLLRDPVTYDQADALILESTYGDRDHRPLDQTLDEFAEILAAARADGGKVIIPSFAVGRTQQLIYFLGELRREGRVPADTRVFIDSPMAISTTELYRRHRESFDDEAWDLIERGVAPLDFPNLQFMRTADESRSLNKLDDGAVIISASGMCTGGRILHHLKHNLWKSETRLVIVGFQAEGTLGRRLVDGEKRVRIMGDDIAVKAHIHTLGGFSAHAGRSELINWTSTLADAKPRVFLNHGEPRPRELLRRALEDAFAFNVQTPGIGDTFEL